MLAAGAVAAPPTAGDKQGVLIHRGTQFPAKVMFKVLTM